MPYFEHKKKKREKRVGTREFPSLQGTSYALQNPGTSVLERYDEVLPSPPPQPTASVKSHEEVSRIGLTPDKRWSIEQKRF
jgi:hypothetical protein